MVSGIVTGNIAVDCKDAAELRNFYAALLGAETLEKWHCPALKLPGGTLVIFMQDDEFEYAPPVWPEEPGKPQKQMHFDFQANDIEEAAKEAERLGARRAEKQYGGEWWITMIDPDGHPFCLCRKEA
jgi:catechol 2,3-dioxygenase-like lactoylglutathione lyase family enzyme